MVRLLRSPARTLILSASRHMRAGDLGVILISSDSAQKGDRCIFLEEPALSKVGAWGAHEEVLVLCRGKEIRLPVYFVRASELPVDSQG